MPIYRSNLHSPLDANPTKYRGGGLSPLDANPIKYRSREHSALPVSVGPSQLWFLKIYAGGNNIVKVDIPTFTYTFGPAITFFYPTTSRALIDPNNQYYYVGGDNGVYVINLPEGTIYTHISFAGYTLAQASAIVIDRYRRFLYAIASVNPSYVFKIDLSTFTIIGYGTIAGVPSAVTAIINDVDNNFIYALGIGKFYRISLSTLTLVDIIGGPLLCRPSVIDIPNNYGYFGKDSPFTGAGIARLRLSDFVWDATCAIPTGYGWEMAIAGDFGNNRLYYIPAGNTRLYQINVSAFSIIQSIDLVAEPTSPGGLVIDSEHQKLYIGYGGSFASIQRFDIPTYLPEGIIDYDDEAALGVSENQNTV